MDYTNDREAPRQVGFLNPTFKILSGFLIKSVRKTFLRTNDLGQSKNT